jgi:endonuclease/exonuclease/phosphatase family metal-dependent hydrolase
MEKIKIAALNLQAGVGTTKSYLHYMTTFWKYALPHSHVQISNVASFIRSENLDIAIFSEVNTSNKKESRSNQPGFISKETRLKKNIFFKTFDHKGIAICTKYSVLSSVRRKLPGRGWPRFLGEVILDTGKKRLTVLFTHLSLSRDNHRMQIKYLAARVNQIDGPVILAGDFNVWNRHEIALLKGSRLRNTGFYKTYPSWKPQMCLDYIFLSKEFKLKRAYAPSIKVSDHLPLVAEVNLY